MNGDASNPSVPDSMRYWCFISYRHADNKEEGRQWATWLHHAIETYEVPGDLAGTTNERGDVIPERIFPVFRDEEELPADADLSSPIYRALDTSRMLIVICSPRVVASTYVNDEIRYFKKLGGEDRVLAVMVEGEPNASRDAGKQSMGFRVEDECFPDALRQSFGPDGAMREVLTEPIAADFRLGQEQGWTSPEAYRQAMRRDDVLSAREIERRVEEYRQRSHLMPIASGLVQPCSWPSRKSAAIGSVGPFAQRFVGARLVAVRRENIRLRRGAHRLFARIAARVCRLHHHSQHAILAAKF